MKKRIFNFGFVGLIIVSSANANAYDIEQDGINYNIGSLTERVLAVTYNSSSKYSGDIVIPESVTVNDQEYAVTSIGENAFAQCSALKSVSIPNTVTCIGKQAFAYCAALETLNLPAALTSIPSQMLYYCSSLKEIEIPSSVKSIGKEAFSQCSQITSVDLPAQVSVIGDYAFHYCTNLKTVSIPESVTFLGNYVFAMCPMLESIEMQPKKPLSCIAGFTNDVLDNAILYVPEGTAELYRTTSPWSDFKNIQEKLYTGIEKTDGDINEGVHVNVNKGVISVASNGSEVTIYDINGKVVFTGTDNCSAELGKGFYIVKAGKLTKKIVL